MKFLISLLFLLLTLLSIVIYIYMTTDIQVVPTFDDEDNTTQQDESNITDPKKIEKRFQRDYFESKWEDVQSQLNRAIQKYMELDRATEGNFFWDKKASLREELYLIFDEIVAELKDERIAEYKEQMQEIRQEIKNDIVEIHEYEEEMKEAPKESYIYTTVDGYKEKIKELEEVIKAKKETIENTQESIYAYIYVLGIELPYTKIDMLMKRIDFQYMYDAALVMKMLKTLMIKIKKDTMVNKFHYSKTLYYHNVNRVLFEFILYQQSRYIQTIDEIYIPQLLSLLKRNDHAYEKNAKLKQQTRNATQKAIYQDNMRALKIFRQAAEIYKKDLLAQRKRLWQVRLMSAKHLQLTQDRYKTSKLSIESLKPIRDMNEEFTKIIRHYFDNIEITFKDKRLKKKYIEITQKLH